MRLEFNTENTAQTEEAGRRLAELLEGAGISRAFIALRGEMGVGKTAFTRGFASHFGIGAVKSPTFTVLNEYRGRCRIHHFDLYRITDGDDLYSIGFDDIIEEEGYSVAEWSENIEDYLPNGHITVTISRLSVGSAGYDTEGRDTSLRKISIDIPGIKE